jgi:hypothetical protein
VRHILATLFLVGCTPDISITKQAIDADNDGYDEEVDCNDASQEVHPDADEVCDGEDNDCDGDIDEDPTDGETLYADVDGDGAGDATTATPVCSDSAGWVADDSDCDDNEARSFPGNPEVCDGIDNDCDGAIDDAATDVSTWYADTDGDGYGDASVSAESCEAPAGYVADATDCDDSVGSVHPGAEEADCTDPVDYNCDGSSALEDADGDGSPACEDCDDRSPTIHPGASEVCDAADVDEDCDGTSDDDDPTASGAPTWYRDSDSDGYHDGTGASLTQCEQPSGYVDAAGDCDDYDSAVNPAADEICDDADLDEDCDGASDDDDASTLSSSWIAYYRDNDMDGYGDTSRTVTQCDAPASYVDNDDDCDDADASRNPGASEVCDAADLDEDCDGLADGDDPSLTGATTWYADADGDGYGTSPSTTACDQPAGYAAAAGDCDDTDDEVSPGAIEVCDPSDADEDCDGLADDEDTSATGGATWYLDADGDGHGASGTSVVACTQPASYVAADDDCDDSDAEVYTLETWYLDADGDGYGDASTAVSACGAPAGYAGLSTDCDDGDDAIHPDADESDCEDPVDYNCDGASGYVDGDGDGYAACEDCNDTSASTSPGATEVCDAADIDEDCDGLADDADPSATGTSTWYRDRDRDGYHDGTGASLVQCDQPTGYSDDADDCDDYDGTVNPAADEICDPSEVDEDCDGVSDDDDASTLASSWNVYYRDSDGDGYGDASRSVTQCEAPSSYVENDDDCDDAASGRNPGESEICDASDTDEDCDGLADEDDPSLTNARTWYADADGDGYGTTSSTEACDQPTGYDAVSGDCDDTDNQVSPAEAEVCDVGNTDEDCSGAADDADGAATGQTTWYADNDGDGHGNASATRTACDRPSGYVATGDDCDDTDVGTYAIQTWYADLDADGYGDAATAVSACGAPGGYVASSSDCDDTDADVNPGETELCDAGNTDEDCDGNSDDDDSAATGETAWYRDADRDGYGSSATSTAACDQPSGYVANATDCNDASASISPSATEVCDSSNTDEDCDGAADDADASVTGESTWYADADADGHGDSSVSTAACEQPSGYTSAGGDCDDSNAAAYALATWYDDADADGYGDATSGVSACGAPVGYVGTSTDCDDGDAAINPGETEICDASDTDEDCDGTSDDYDTSATGKTTWYRDADGDAYGASSTSTAACDQPSGYVAVALDCNDTSASISPSATERCDASNTDEDCDGLADDADASATGKTTWYADADADLYGDPAVSQAACDVPVGYTSNGTDCDDTSAGVSPADAEVCDAADVDEDCDGLADDADSSTTGETTWYPDADADGYGTSSGSALACDEPSGYARTADDCDDADAGIHPGATETCDGEDDDCDGTTDFVDEDLDADGYSTCDLDCDDADASVNPGTVEICGNGLDDDCDGTADSSDGDGDGYAGCDGEDCNDYSDLVYPGATEISDDKMDNDCDGTVDDEGIDDDGDGVTENAGDCDDAAPWIGPGAVEIPDTEVDEDCDGDEQYAIDLSSSAIYVDANLGSDFFPGTQQYPAGSLGRGVTLAAAAGKFVVAAEGTYTENVSTTVHIFGGYASDWSEVTGLSVVDGSLTYSSSASGVVVSGLEIEGVVEAVGDGIFHGGAVYADSSEPWAVDATSGSLGIAESVIEGPQSYTSGDIATVVIGAGGGWVYDSWVVGGDGGDGTDGADGSGTTSESVNPGSYCTYFTYMAAFTAGLGNAGAAGADAPAVVGIEVVDGGSAIIGGSLVLGGAAGRGGAGGDGADGSQSRGTDRSTGTVYNIYGGGGAAGEGGDGGELVLVKAIEGEVALIGSFISGGSLATGGSAGAAGDAAGSTCISCSWSWSYVDDVSAYGGSGADAGEPSSWYGAIGNVSAWGSTIGGPSALTGATPTASGVGTATDCCSNYYNLTHSCFGDEARAAGASAGDPSLVGAEIDDASFTPSSDPTFLGNRVLLQESSTGGGWSGLADGVPFESEAVTGISTTSGTVSRNVVSVVTAGTATGIIASDTVTGHSNLVELLGTDDAIGIRLDGEDSLLVNSTVVLDGAGTGLWITGSHLDGLLNNLVQTGSGGTCIEDESSTRDYMRNNLVYGCTGQLYHDSLGYRTRASELNFITVTTSAGGHVYSSPLFTDAANSDYTLSATSPAVNVGYDVSGSPFGAVTYDVEGATCPSDGNYDIGAYER